MTADNKQQTAADGRTLVIAAAGTGGHVMPGLAVARVMADRGWKIVWILSLIHISEPTRPY